MVGSAAEGTQQALIAWFGIRDIGSVYYLMFALSHGLTGTAAERLTALTLTVVAASIVVHGISVTPVMHRYRARTAHR